MIISHKHGFIFQHLMKTAGTSITRNLLPFLGKEDVILGCLPEYELSIPITNSDLKLDKHSSFETIKLYLGEEKWESYFKFTFVRNPYDLLVSLYHWWQKTPAVWSEKGLDQKSKIMGVDFKGFIMSQITLPSNYMTENLYKKNDNGETYTEFDFIGRYENLQADFDKVCERINFPEIMLSVNNESKDIQAYADYRHFYDDEMIAQVNKLFGEDLEILKYNF